MAKYKKIMDYPLKGYHTQVNKMKTNDNNAILKTRKRGRVF